MTPPTLVPVSVEPAWTPPQTGPSTYFCRNDACDAQVESCGIPNGWYKLGRVKNRQSEGVPYQNRGLGLYCSLKCAFESVQDLWDKGWR